MKYSMPLFVLLMGADLVTTFIGLHFGAIESNPLWSQDLMVWVKLIAVVMILAGFRVVKYWKPAVYYARVVTGIMALVVLNNLIVLALQMQGGMNAI